MTRGSIPRILINFAIPLLIGNIFQQLYNTVDSVVVGNFVGKPALAAVGCTGPIINALIGLFSGLASGASVIISQHYGAKDEEKLFKTVQTTVAMTLIMCVLLTALGVLAAPWMLRLMDTPEDVFQEADTYLTIYFWGIAGMLLYNIGSGILRAVGDSTRPLYFLIFSALTNTVLDVLFVRYFSMGIAGAAVATVISQFLSALLVTVLLVRSTAAYRVDLRRLKPDGRILGRICSIGIPTALQMFITSISNVFVQAYVNRFESACMAGWTAYNRIDAFANLPMMSLSIALSTFVGQNLGAGRAERVKAAPRYGMIMGFIMMAVILTPLMLFAPQLTRMFNQDAEVVRFGAFFIRLISPFYLAFSVNQVLSGVLRGAGDTKSTMVILLSSYVVFRQIYLFVSYRLTGSLTAVALGYPAGWVMCGLLLLVYFYGYKRSRLKASV